jgi:hypothetical protein
MNNKDNQLQDEAEVCEFIIHINGGVTIDVREHYRKLGFDKLPPEPTITAALIRAYDDASPPRANYTIVWDGDLLHDIQYHESVKLFNGMTFVFVPPAHY